MNNQNNPIANNLRSLRNRNNWSLEYVAERLEVSRQAVAKWENGDSLPDVMKCDALASLYDVTLTDLIRHNEETEGIPIGPAGKHIFGIVPVGARGQIVLPKKGPRPSQYRNRRYIDCSWGHEPCLYRNCLD